MDSKKSNDNTPKSRYFLFGLTLFISGAALIGLYYVLFHSTQLFVYLGALTSLIMPIIYGFVLAYIMIPILNFIERRAVVPLFQKCKVDVNAKKSKIRAISVLITSVVCVFVVYSFIHMFVAQIVPSIREIINNFDTYVNNIVSSVNRLFESNSSLRYYFNEIITRYSTEFEGWLDNTIMPRISTIVMNVSVSVLNILGFFWDFIIGFILSIYILNSKDVFAMQAKKITYGIFANDKANNILSDVRYIHKTFTGFISGKVLDSIIIGIICFIGTSILNTPYAALVSLIIGATNVIPFFGPFLGAIPCSVLIFVVAPTEPLHTVYFIIFVLLLQQFDGNILGPKILGDSTGLGSFWVIFAITIFGGLFGVAGMVIGVPTFAVIFAAIRRFVNRRLLQKGLPIDRDEYASMQRIDGDNQIIQK